MDNEMKTSGEENSPECCHYFDSVLLDPLPEEYSVYSTIPGGPSLYDLFVDDDDGEQTLEE